MFRVQIKRYHCYGSLIGRVFMSELRTEKIWLLKLIDKKVGQAKKATFYAFKIVA